MLIEKGVTRYGRGFGQGGFKPPPFPYLATFFLKKRTKISKSFRHYEKAKKTPRPIFLGF
jgi:hypothetical protein